MVVDFNDLGDKVISPVKLAHVVLRTNNFAKMTQFYKDFLGAKVAAETPGLLSFLTYDDEHHRIAIVNIPPIKNKDKDSCGLEHVAFTFSNISHLFLAYRQRKARGMEPYWCINHGPTISLYYRDPDGNNLETQVDCFDTPEEATAYMMSPEFAENPLGVDYDPEEMIKRIESGESWHSLRKRPNIGPRDLSTVPGV